jgi:hypothetical protein
MITESIVVHKFASVIVTKAVPLPRLVAVAVFIPLDHKKVYVAVPPVGVTVPVPSFAPKQEISVEVVDEVKGVGSVMVTLSISKQFEASVIVNV